MLLVAVVFFLWSIGRDVPNEWGDDWAGYLLQARAIAAGTVAEEFAANAAVIDETDTQIGPYAYPWGYPLLLAALGPWTRWEPRALTLAGLAALFLLTPACFWLIRQYLGPRLSLFCTCLATLQAPVLVASLRLTSDLPFAALTIAALALAAHAHHTLESDAPVSLTVSLALPFVAVSAFAVRSNGAILIASHAALVAMVAFRPNRRRTALAHLAIFTGITCLLVGAYFVAWPDGSLGHARLLVFDPRQWPPRLTAHARNLASFFPFGSLHGSVKPAFFGAAMALALVGAGTAARRAAPLTLFVVGHFGLLTLFPYEQGSRYYLPVVAPLIVLIAIGASRGWAMVVQARPERRRTSKILIGAATAVCLTAAVLGTAGELSRRLDALRAGTGPFSQATSDLVHYLRDKVPAQCRIAYRKPRALRYLSGYSVVALVHAAHLGNVDIYVFDMEHADEQLPEAALIKEDLFMLVHEQPPYRVYQRRTPLRITDQTIRSACGPSVAAP